MRQATELSQRAKAGSLRALRLPHPQLLARPTVCELCGRGPEAGAVLSHDLRSPVLDVLHCSDGMRAVVHKCTMHLQHGCPFCAAGKAAKVSCNIASGNMNLGCLRTAPGPLTKDVVAPRVGRQRLPCLAIGSKGLASGGAGGKAAALVK